jgi:hypothetical protein
MAAKIMHMITVPMARPPFNLPKVAYISPYRPSAIPLLSKKLAIRMNKGIAPRITFCIMDIVETATISILPGPQKIKANMRAQLPKQKAMGIPNTIIRSKTPNINSVIASGDITISPR